MIKIISNEVNKFNYTCDCGAHGFCLIKPMDIKKRIVLDLKCPLCSAIERLTIEQSADKDDLTWAIIIENKILD